MLRKPPTQADAQSRPVDQRCKRRDYRLVTGKFVRDTSIAVRSILTDEKKALR